MDEKKKPIQTWSVGVELDKKTKRIKRRWCTGIYADERISYLELLLRAMEEFLEFQDMAGAFPFIVGSGKDTTNEINRICLELSNLGVDVPASWHSGSLVGRQMKCYREGKKPTIFYVGAQDKIREAIREVKDEIRDRKRDVGKARASEKREGEKAKRTEDRGRKLIGAKEIIPAIRKFRYFLCNEVGWKSFKREAKRHGWPVTFSGRPGGLAWAWENELLVAIGADQEAVSEQDERERNEKATLSEQHNYGKQGGTVLPVIGGHIRKRRSAPAQKNT